MGKDKEAELVKPDLTSDFLNKKKLNSETA